MLAFLFYLFLTVYRFYKRGDILALFLPNIILNSVTEVTYELIDKMNIKGLLVDADKTLAYYGKNEPLEGVAEWLALMKKKGIKMVIISNNYKKRIRPLADNLGIKYFVANAFKPTPLGIIRALRKIKIKRKNVAVIGDQIYTDILGANICGLKSIYVIPKNDKDVFHSKFVAFMEKIHIKRYYKKHGGK